ncbi:MAG: hypothetical protein AB7F64_04300 [Gammaproteobacteria bacterium]
MSKNKLSSKNARLKDLVKSKQSQGDKTGTGDSGGDDSGGGGFQNYFLGNLKAARAQEMIGKDPNKARHFEKFLRDTKTDASELQTSELADIVESDHKANTTKKANKTSSKGTAAGKGDARKTKQTTSGKSGSGGNYGHKSTNPFGSPIHSIAQTREASVKAKSGGQQTGVITGPHTFHEGASATTRVFTNNAFSKSRSSSGTSTTPSSSPKKGR